LWPEWEKNSRKESLVATALLIIAGMVVADMEFEFEKVLEVQGGT